MRVTCALWSPHTPHSTVYSRPATSVHPSPSPTANVSLIVCRGVQLAANEESSFHNYEV